MARLVQTCDELLKHWISKFSATVYVFDRAYSSRILTDLLLLAGAHDRIDHAILFDVGIGLEQVLFPSSLHDEVDYKAQAAVDSRPMTVD